MVNIRHFVEVVLRKDKKIFDYIVGKISKKFFSFIIYNSCA